MPGPAATVLLGARHRSRERREPFPRDEHCERLTNRPSERGRAARPALVTHGDRDAVGPCGGSRFPADHSR